MTLPLQTIIERLDESATPSLNWDRKDGMGAVPNQQTIDYFGFTKEMSPDRFLSLVPPRDDDEGTDRVLAGAQEGKAIGPPFLQVEWDAKKKQWQVLDHEGRGRCKAIRKLYGNIMIPVDMFPSGGMRARDLTPEMINAPIRRQHWKPLPRVYRDDDGELQQAADGELQQATAGIKRYLRTQEAKDSSMRWTKVRLGVRGFNVPVYRHVTVDGRFEISPTTEKPGSQRNAHLGKQTYWRVWDAQRRFTPARTYKSIDAAKQDIADYLRNEATIEPADAILDEMTCAGAAGGYEMPLGATPYWKRRKRRKGLKESADPRPFLRFYKAAERGLSPDREDVWACLAALTEYYADYDKWYYKKFADRAYKDSKEKKTQYRIWQDFKKRLAELQAAARSRNLPDMIVAVDTGINQWHHDFPVVHHFYMQGFESDDPDEEEEGERLWGEMEDILFKLGRIPEKSPYVEATKYEEKTVPAIIGVVLSDLEVKSKRVIDPRLVGHDTLAPAREMQPYNRWTLPIGAEEIFWWFRPPAGYFGAAVDHLKQKYSIDASGFDHVIYAEEPTDFRNRILGEAANLYDRVMAVASPTSQMVGDKAWLTPDGKWLNSDEHRDLIPCDDDSDLDISVQDMCQAGFIRVAWEEGWSGDCNVLHAEFSRKTITHAQRVELKNTAIERGGEVAYDPGYAWTESSAIDNYLQERLGITAADIVATGEKTDWDACQLGVELAGAFSTNESDFNDIWTAAQEFPNEWIGDAGYTILQEFRSQYAEKLAAYITSGKHRGKARAEGEKVA